jgi:hypothetical protein
MHETDMKSVAARLQHAQGQSKQLRLAQSINRVSQVLSEVISTARLSIETKQVEELDLTISKLFKKIIGSEVKDGHYKHVGVRHVQGSDRDFEPYILGPKGLDKPMGSANGASRRAVAISLLLGITRVTGTSIPFVADSLLHATSGNVKLNLVKYLTDGKSIGQPIIFVTGDDLSAPTQDDEGIDVLSVVLSRAGKMYTITSQSQVGTNVRNSDPDATLDLESVLCNCGPSEACKVCQLNGNNMSPHVRLMKKVNR